MFVCMFVLYAFLNHTYNCEDLVVSGPKKDQFYTMTLQLVIFIILLFQIAYYRK